MQTKHGVIHGKTIELSDAPNLADGMEVEVVIRPVSERKWGAGLQHAAGAFAADWTEEDDRILQNLEQERKQAAYREQTE